MKIHHLIRVMVSVMIMLFSVIIGSDKESLSFDSLFPDNWYTKAMQTCMHIWSDLDALISQPVEESKMLYAIDVSTGRISYCIMCIKKLAHDESITIVEDDLLYLGRVAMSLHQRCELLINNPAYQERAMVLKQALQKFRTVISNQLGR